jgi:hypothetical protein
VYYREDTHSTASGPVAELKLEATAQSKEMSFARLTLHADLSETSDPNVTLVTLTVPESGSRHELRFSRLVRGSSGLIYVRHPVDATELQISCASNAPPAPALTTSATAVQCEVTERVSPGGAVEATRSVVVPAQDDLAPPSPTVVALRGATFSALLSTPFAEGGGFSVNADWTVERDEKGISQLLQFGSSGEKKLFGNQLADGMTGTASVVTPIGTEVSYICTAQ